MSNEIFAIVAALEDGGIGKDNKLPFRIKTDLKFFETQTTITKDPTKKNVVIIGRKSWESLPKNSRPLKNRFNVILTSDPNYEKNMSESGEILVARTMKEALDYVWSPSRRDCFESVYILGGSRLYDEALLSPLCTRVYLTQVHATLPCDAFFSMNLLKQYFTVSHVGDTIEEGGFKYTFCTYERIKSNK